VNENEVCKTCDGHGAIPVWSGSIGGDSLMQDSRDCPDCRLRQCIVALNDESEPAVEDVMTVNDVVDYLSELLSLRTGEGDEWGPRFWSERSCGSLLENIPICFRFSHLSRSWFLSLS